MPGQLAGAMLILLLAGTPSLGFAQVQDTLGVVDTLRFGVVAAPPGAAVVVPVNVTNDYAILGLSIPVVYPASVLRADSVTFANGRISQFAQLIANIDQARGALLIGAIQFTGDPLAAGSGAVAWIHFTVSPDAVVGSQAPVDTGYFSDPGTLLFSVDVDGGTGVVPAVAAGYVTIMAPNLPPQFSPLPDQTVREGDSLNLELRAVDAEGESIRLAAVNKPPGASFVDRGDGTGRFSWCVPYTGPYAAGSGTELKFAADDGIDVSVLNVAVQEINVNRPPILELADTITVSAFDSLNWQVSAYDPDLEPVTISLSGLPDSVDVGSGNPVSVRWEPIQADTGYYAVTVLADDGHGGQTEGVTTLRVEPVPRVEFALDTVSGFVDQDIVLPIRMKNSEAIAGFDLLFHLDPTAVTVTGFDLAGTRIENWEMFAPTLNYGGNPGDVRIYARADVADGTPTPNLDAGEGVIVKVKLHIISDASYAGLSFPVRFVFRTTTANTAIDATNTIITQDQIAYTHGAVNIVRYDNILPGDLNLNGLAFEIGDVVILANYLSNPILYPLSFEQRANSDANQDGLQATIADLVFMINKLAGGGLLRSAPSAGQTASWSLSPSGSLALQSQAPLGGALIVYHDVGAGEPTPGPAAAGMKFRAERVGDAVRVIIYSMTGATIDPDAGDLLEGIPAAHDFEVQLSDQEGRLLKSGEGVRPVGPSLLGNFPNPFNPSTAIRFSLAEPGEVRIAIFNTLGQQVNMVAGTFGPGVHELTWNGRDAQDRPVSSGVYFYRLEAAGSRDVRRMLLLK